MKHIVGILLALCLASPAYGRMPTLEDEQYRTACGPIAGLVALSTLGIETTALLTMRNKTAGVSRIDPLRSWY